MPDNQIHWLDFTLFVDPEASSDEFKILVEMIMVELRSLAKKWAFQLEKAPTTSNLHYQGRLVLINRVRFSTFLKRLKVDESVHYLKHAHWSVTNNNCHNFDYVKKSDTRIEGPWTSDGIYGEIPRDIKDLKMYSWQATMARMADEYEPRKIFFLYDPDGNSGKSTIAKWLCFFKQACDCPAMNNFKDVLQFAASWKKNHADCKCFLFDMPRASNQENLSGMYSAIECIKSGKITDTRYCATTILMDPPTVFVYGNHIPNRNLLSEDRWQYFRIARGWDQEKKEPSDEKILVEFFPRWDEDGKYIPAVPYSHPPPSWFKGSDRN